MTLNAILFSPSLGPKYIDQETFSSHAGSKTKSGRVESVDSKSPSAKVELERRIKSEATIITANLLGMIILR